MIRSFVKVEGCLIPCDPPTIKAFDSMKNGVILQADFKKKNNPDFHRKLFSLFNYAYSCWEPGQISSKYGTPEKNFDRFRKDITIMAGFFDLVIRLDGTSKPEAKSLSFGKMDNDEREQVYQKVLTVIMERIFPQFEAVEVEATAKQMWDNLVSYT